MSVDLREKIKDFVILIRQLGEEQESHLLYRLILTVYINKGSSSLSKKKKTLRSE